MALARGRIEQIAVIVGLALLVIGTVLVLRPFLTSLLWALILAIATWPTFTRLRNLLHGRRTLAATIMVLALTVGVLLPLIVVVVSLADNVTGLAARVRLLLQEGPPPPPDWLFEIPLVGNDIWSFWQELTVDSDRLTGELTKFIPQVTNWLLVAGAELGQGILELALSLVVAVFLYRDGAVVAERLDTLVGRLAGKRAQDLLDVAHDTMKGVVYGLIGTALAQGVLAGIGFWLAGVPGPFFLGLVTFFVSIFPFGAPLVWGPATAWLFVQGETGWGIFLGIWGVAIVSSADNFLKPILIGQASALPLLLVFLGILGGASAFGFLGIFIGPTLLAVMFTLLREWKPRTSAKET